MLLTSKDPLEFTETPEALSSDDLRLNSLSKKKGKCLLEVIKWIDVYKISVSNPGSLSNYYD